ncbi:MAG: diguanylate cyclase [Alphaproteobacteria bacterium]|nr:diguanylate cyclase [Alphaproteobacteria bacterium]
MAVAERTGKLDLPALTGAFDSYPGPVLALDEDARLVPLNAAAIPVADDLNGDTGVSLMPAMVQLAVKTRSENRAKTRTFTLPSTGRQVEFIMLPQSDGSQLLIGRDATLEVSIRSALAESRTRFKDLVEVAADFAWETDRDGLICYISPRGAIGYAPEELLGEAPETLLLAPESAPKPLPFLADVIVRNVEVWVRTRGGEPACILVSAIPVLDKDGILSGTRGIAIDVTEERQRQSELARLKIRERLVSYIVDSLRNEVTPTEMLHSAATALGRSTSASACIVQVRGPHGTPLDIAAFGTAPDPDLAEEAMNAILAKHGSAVEGGIGPHKYLGIATDYRGETNGGIVLWRDDDGQGWDDEEHALLKAVEPQFGIVFRQIADQHQLEHLSRTDDLTGLRNRRAFMEDLSREMARYERYREPGALLFVDLDNFKPINDRFGHEKGDEALKAIADILSGATRTYDLTCRLGGDEFAAWIEGADREIGEARAEKFLSSLEVWKAEHLDPEIGFGMSIGVAMFEPGTGETVEGLIARADAAMYDAKKGGKNRIVFAESRIADA